MKKRRSFFRRHIIAIMILVFVIAYASYSTLQKELIRQDLLDKEAEYLEEIEAKKDELKELERDIERIGTLEYIEEYAREELKMVAPEEYYFQIYYDDREEDE